MEIDVQVGGESMNGPWEPAGPDWHLARTQVVQAIVSVDIQGDHPETLAQRWSAVLGLQVDMMAGVPTIGLDNATLRFTVATDGRGEGLAGIGVRVQNGPALIAAASARGCRVDDAMVMLGGIGVTLID